MKKWPILLIFCLFLSGCASEQTMETISDPVVQTVMGKPREFTVRLPDGAVAPVLESDLEQVYTAEDYEIILETLAAGDLDGTIRHLSGWEREDLTVVQTEQEGICRYDFVWAAAGEQGERLGRGVILDDGSYHYCMTVLRDQNTQRNTQIVWEDVFQSFALT